MSKKEFIELLKNKGIILSDKQIEQFDKYFKLLVEWNEKMNLTAITDEEGVYLKHFYDSITIAFDFEFASQSIVDVGAGAGFPSIPLKIIYPDLKVTIVDSLTKRITFLNRLFEALELTNCKAISARAEEYAKENREKCDVVMARAVARLNILDELCLPLVKVGGYFLSLKGLKADEELNEAKKGIGILGGKVESVNDFTLTNDNHRSNIIIKKVKATPNKYPRMFAKIKKTTIVGENMLEKVYKQIDINKIEANENQPRKVFDDEKIEELATSIKENGLIQPIIVRKYNRNYQIIAGERRFRACKLAGLKTIPCVIKDIDDKQVDTYAIIENIQRENLSPIEEASAYKTLIDTYNMNQTELANKVGKKQSTIANKLRLLKLSDDVKYALKAKQITERHARAMLSLDEQKQQEVLKEVLKKSLNVKQTETLINKPVKAKEKPKKVTTKISKNFKIAMNTINQAIDLIQKSGIDVTSETQEADEEYVITLKVKK